MARSTVTKKAEAPKMALLDKVLAEAPARDKPKSTTVTVKLTEADHAAIRRASDQSGLSMGGVVAGIVRAALAESE